MQFSYPATLTSDKKNNGFVVTFVDFPEAITQGETLDDAILQASDCLAEAVANRISEHITIPTPSKSKRCKLNPMIDVQPEIAAKAAIYLTTQESGLSNTKLAKLMECDEKEIRRLLDPHHLSRLPRIEKLLEKLGRHLVISLRTA